MRIPGLLALMLALVACGPTGPGGPGPCASDDPSVISVSLLPDSAAMGEGGGNIDVSVTFEFRTRDGARLLLLGYRLVDEGGATIIGDAVDLGGLGLKGSGTHSFNVSLPTHTAQVYRFRMRLTDECFSESRWAETDFSVT